MGFFFFAFHFTTLLACRVNLPIAFVSCVDCARNASQLLMISLGISDSEVLGRSPSQSIEQLSVG